MDYLACEVILVKSESKGSLTPMKGGKMIFMEFQFEPNLTEEEAEGELYCCVYDMNEEAVGFDYLVQSWGLFEGHYEDEGEDE